MSFSQKNCFQILDHDAQNEDVSQFINHVQDFSLQADQLPKLFEIFDYFMIKKYKYQNFFSKLASQIKLLVKNNNSLYYYLYGLCLHHGCGIDKNYTKAISYYEKAVTMNDHHAMNTLGFVYDLGIGIEINHKISFSILFSIFSNE